MRHVNRSRSSLPELITSICGTLDHTDIMSLRHIIRRLAVNSTDGFRYAHLDSITATSSLAGLERLDRLLTLPEQAKKIKHVTLHVFTPWGLKALANTFPNGEENPYLLAYDKVRTALHDGLNALPNLESITITNGKFKEITEPPFPLQDEPRFDPICEVDRKSRGNPLTPRIYGFESALSLLPSLTKQLSLHLNIDYANLNSELTRIMDCGENDPRPFIGYSIAGVVGLSPTYEDHVTRDFFRNLARPFTIGYENTKWLCMVPVQEAMFGIHDFEANKVVEEFVRHLTLRGSGKEFWPLRTAPAGCIL
jgi:hypothetical protein